MARGELPVDVHIGDIVHAAEAQKQPSLLFERNRAAIPAHARYILFNAGKRANPRIGHGDLSIKALGRILTLAMGQELKLPFAVQIQPAGALPIGTRKFMLGDHAFSLLLMANRWMESGQASSASRSGQR